LGQLDCKLHCWHRLLATAGQLIVTHLVVIFLVAIYPEVYGYFSLSQFVS
jgi:hypothetical protein